MLNRIIEKRNALEKEIDELEEEIAKLEETLERLSAKLCAYNEIIEEETVTTETVEVFADNGIAFVTETEV